MGISKYRFVFTLLLLLAYSTTTFGQVQQLTIGQQIKVSASSVSDDEIIGIVTEVSDTLIKIQVSDRDPFRPRQGVTSQSFDNESIIDVPIRNIDSIAFRGGERRGNAGRGAILGG